MKKSIIPFAYLLFVSCNANVANTNLEGEYTCNHENEFGKTEDTLFLVKVNANYFKIEKHAGVIRTVDGKVFPKELIVERWQLEYDGNKMKFTEMKTGRIIIWNADKHSLVYGNKEYKKI